ncbi:hypothetical protein NEMIN01_2320, partial [Nematocida minor]|uniref:uncharacterized protein n=1 Tax=Nematocida minor TaxID=1912983 RepID=UPI0022205C94
MKNMVSALVVLLSLFIRECRGGGHSSSAERSTDDPMIGEGGTARQRNSKANHDSLDPNPALDAVTNEKECDYNNFDMVDKPWVGLAGDIEDVAKQYNLTQQDIKNLDTYENVFNKADSNRSASSPSAGKRKASCTVDSSVDGSESVAGEKRRKEEDSVYVDDKREDDDEYIDAEIEAAIDNYIQMISRLRASAGKKNKETIAPKEHSMVRWQSTKLTNLVRHRHVITYDNLHECRHSAKYLNGLAKDNVYQRKLKNDIKYFFDNISSLIKDNGFLYFLASRPTRLNPKHRYLFGTKYLCVNSENTAYKKMVESFAGYYPGIVDDLIAYLEENEPMKIREDKFPAEWKRTLGDIYMSECPKVNYKMFKKQRNIAQVDSRHRALAYAMHMIIMLPEVYQDFSKISEKFIEETCNSMSDDKDRNKRNVQIILVMREIMRMHIGEIIDEAAYAKLYNMLKSVLGEARMLQATAVDLYAHIYSFLVEFYKKAVIFDKNNRYVLVGKYVIKKQRQIKGEIVVNMAAGKPEERMSAPSYSFEEGIWSVSPVKHSHYHVYYVDNTMGQPRRLCMPIYKGEESKEEQYLHTIDGIVEYIKELYEMAKNSDFIHPFKVDKETKKWSYISASDRSKTAKELEGYEVVFYHIKDSLEENFTFAEFEPAEPYGANR